jgi:hypothetical protein
MTSGCTQVENLRNPEVAACEAYLLETLKSPSSYKRVSFTVVDTTVSKEMLAAAKGGADIDKTLAGIATNPGIREVALDYDADNSFGSNLRGGTACYFPMSDIEAGEPSGDLDSMVRMHASATRLVQLGVVPDAKETLCCLAPTFDVSTIPDEPASLAAEEDAITALEDAK